MTELKKHNKKLFLIFILREYLRDNRNRKSSEKRSDNCNKKFIS